MTRILLVTSYVGLLLCLCAVLRVMYILFTVTRRKKAGHCIMCGYAHCGTTCPECGATSGDGWGLSAQFRARPVARLLDGLGLIAAPLMFGAVMRGPLTVAPSRALIFAFAYSSDDSFDEAILGELFERRKPQLDVLCGASIIASTKDHGKWLLSADSPLRQAFMTWTVENDGVTIGLSEELAANACREADRVLSNLGQVRLRTGPAEFSYWYLIARVRGDDAQYCSLFTQEALGSMDRMTALSLAPLFEKPNAVALCVALAPNDVRLSRALWLVRVWELGSHECIHEKLVVLAKSADSFTRDMAEATLAGP